MNTTDTYATERAAYIEQMPIGTDVIVASGARFTVRGHTTYSGPPRVITDRGEWLAADCSPIGCHDIATEDQQN